MTAILSDYNCEGQARAIFAALDKQGLVTLLEVELLFFEDAGLPENTDDATVWHYCQRHGLLLLTGNRTSRDREASLEHVLRRLVTSEHLPVRTISDLQRVMRDREYCRRCAERLGEIVLDVERFRGVSRLWLPGEAGYS